MMPMRYARTLLTILALLAALFLVLTVSGKYAEAPALDDAATSTVPLDGEPPARGEFPYDAPPVSGQERITYSFEYDLPTPCHALSAPEVAVAESYPEQIFISYTVTVPSPDTVCIQVIERVTVTNTITVNTNAVLQSIRVNGTAVAFTQTRSR